MKKIISTFIFCLIICFLPLAGKSHLWLNISFLTIVFFFHLLFFTQPTFNIEKVREHSKTDQHSILFITLALLCTLSGSLIDWGYWQVGSKHWNLSGLSYFGLILLIIGSLIRIWAILHLGKHFSNTVHFNSNHQLITDGPYQWIRHPSYLGAYLAIIGSTLFLQSLLFFILGSILMLLAYQYRIRIEEKGLIHIFPKQYKAYQQNTKKLIPLIY